MTSFVYDRSVRNRYGLAAVIAGISLVSEQIFADLYNFELPFLYLVPIVLMVARFLGFGPSLLTILITGLGADYFFTYPGHTFSLDTREGLLRFLFFVTSCSVFAWLIARWTSLEIDLQSALAELRDTERERLGLLEEARSAKAEADAEREFAQNANRAKSEFLANISHEIRTPLGAVLGFTDLLRDEDLGPAERREFINIISRNGSELVRLIDDLLDLSKVEAGKLEIEKQEVQLHRLLDNVKSLFFVKAKEKCLSFEAECDGLIPETVYTDPLRLRQILINIIGNAIKFTNQGGVQVKARWRRLRSTSVLEFTVSDTGPGIAEHHWHRLFNPFSQADSSTTRIFGGTGLGLALSRDLARALGGDLVLMKSEVGAGSTFQITIDAGETSTTQLSPLTGLDAGRPLSFGSDRLHGLRILLAEDSDDNRFLIRRCLESNGAQVTAVENGKEAVEEAMSGSCDIVLMDIQMPVLDGCSAAKELRRLGYRKPILALTAHALKEAPAKTAEAGCDEHLTKPIDAAVLVESIARFADPRVHAH
jgi:signal transduction histidine kinase/CheY-like chemotaxis protein